MKSDYKRPPWLDDPATRLVKKNAFDASLVMGTAKFNQSTGRIAPKNRPFLWAIDKNTNLIKADLVRARRCPVCASTPGPGLFVKDGFRHVKCPECGLIYVSLILREDVMEKYWREEMAWLGVLNSGPQMELDKAKFTYGLEVAESHLTADHGRRLLDIGTGSGLFVRLADEAGWQTTALEFNQESTKKLRHEGFEVIVKPLEMADLPTDSFDLISLWEVLEHLPEPRLILKEIIRILAPGGVLIILVPNMESMVTRLLHEKSNTFGGHSHLNHFNLKSLLRLVESVGLEAAEYETIITELGTINNHLSFNDPYQGDSAQVWEELSPKLIHERLWGSRLLLIAKKKSI